MRENAQGKLAGAGAECVVACREVRRSDVVQCMGCCCAVLRMFRLLVGWLVGCGLSWLLCACCVRLVGWLGEWAGGRLCCWVLCECVFVCLCASVCA